MIRYRVLFHSTADLASFKEQGLPKILKTHKCPSPRKSLVKGERLIRHEERPEHNLNLPRPAKALTPPVTSPAVLAFCQHSKLVRSRFHHPEAGKWGGREGRKANLKITDLQALHVSLRIGSTS